MKKVLIPSIIATPIVTLGILVGVNAISVESHKVKEAIQVANTQEVAKPIVAEEQKAIESAPMVSEAPIANTNPVQAPTAAPAPQKLDHTELFILLAKESERLNVQKELRINTGELVYIVIENLGGSAYEDEALGLLRSCKAFYGTMNANSPEFIRAKYEKRCA